MAEPATRNEFKAYVLRRLGSPLLSINVTDDQVEDRINDGLKLFRDYHFDGTTKVYLRHQLTEQDKTNKYITVPDDIQGIHRIFDISGIANVGSGMFDIRYQIALNDLYTLTTQSMVPFFMSMQHLQFIETLLMGQKPIRFNRHENKLHIDMRWDSIATGNWIVAECYQTLNPTLNLDVWADPWLQDYVTALVKQQWGNNIKKFGGMQLPSGQIMNGQIIFDEAKQEIAELRERLKTDYTYPLEFLMG